MRGRIPNKKITKLIKNYGTTKLFSIELNPYMGIVDFHLIDKIRPKFISVTWIGRKNEIKDEPSLILAEKLILKGYVVLLHIPAGCYTAPEMEKILTRARNFGVRNIFAMKGGGKMVASLKDYCDFPSADAFIKYIKTFFGDTFDIVTTGFPNINPWSRTIENEMLFLKQKVVSGATLIITQACLDAEKYIEFKKTCITYAIDIPIITGILILKSYQDFLKILNMSVVYNKEVIREARLQRKRGKKYIKSFARHTTINIIKRNVECQQFAGVHIFTMNNLDLTFNILKESGII